MGLLWSLTVLFLLAMTWFFRPTAAQAPSSTSRAQDLDALLQDYAFRAFVRPKTGIVYDGDLPSNLAGIQISAMRLRSGSLRTKGVIYKEFEIPTGVFEQPYTERIVLVHQNLGNWSMFFYPLPGYTYLAPVLGLLAYDATNLSAKNLPELDIKASDQPIIIDFSGMKMAPDGSVAKCVWFNLQGMVNFSNMVVRNRCSTFQQGHFSIVVESSAFPPTSPAEAPNIGPMPPSGVGKETNSKVWIILGSVLGALALLLLLGLLVLWMQKYKQRKKMVQMEKAAEVGEALHMTSIGSTKAPAAAVMRTQPTLETEYVP